MAPNTISPDTISGDTSAPMKMIIDTDPGVDDAMAIFYAAAAPEIDLIGMTAVFGNVRVDQAARNALALAEMLGLHIAVASGARQPIEMPPLPLAHWIHGAEGLGDNPAPTPKAESDPRDAATFLAETCAAHPGEVTIAAIGPLTNLAEALSRSPEIAETAGRVLIMGGSVRAGGNATEFAEANIWHDPHAADAVFAASWNVEMIGLDVTRQIRCDPDDFAALATKAPVFGGYLSDIAQFYMKFYEERTGHLSCSLHDPAALVAAVHPEWFTWEDAPLSAITSGDRLGETVVVADRKPVSWAATAQSDVVRDHWLETVARLG